MKQLYCWIYLYHSPTDLHYLRRHMQINYLPAGGSVGVVENWVFPVTLYRKQSLFAHKRCFRHYIQDEMKMTSKIFWKQSFPLEIQWYKNTRTGFRFWNVQCSTKHSPHPPTIRISVGRIYFCDITQENNFESKRAIRCSSWKAQKKKTKYLPLEWTLRFVTL